ncbi:hypothetical protein NPX13_g1427 [Xylaria arbuscula]|uniref:Uncharacterized protein n=1 Tax=Xylaria arbuscula TaxID=114810 RepID=A0A9W8TRA1_9PEZI|nr:hypothetical protein NPX13_g1427 [Xylaria arbuscula]
MVANIVNGEESSVTKENLAVTAAPDGQTPPEMIRKRGRPRKDWTVVSVRSKNGQPSSLERTTSSASSHTSSDQGLEKTLHMPWDAQDIELFFHYTAKVCQDLSPADSSLWKDRVPRLSFRCHGVLHLLLAISAFHLSRQDNFRRDELEQRAEMHLALGLRRSTSLLPTLGVENCVELYVSTILVCICSFAKKPRPGHLVLVTDGSEVAWWELFRGVRVIIESIGISTLFAGELGPFSHYGDQDHVPHHYERVNSVAAEWEDALARVSALVSSTPDYNVRDSCQSALNMMIWCFQDTYGTAANPKLTVDAKFSTIMAWPYCLSDEFIRHLKNKESVPLILLTYFAVIIQELDSVWFIEGWALHILQGVSNLLPSDVHEYVQWPILQQRASASSAAQKANSGQ